MDTESFGLIGIQLYEGRDIQTKGLGSKRRSSSRACKILKKVVALGAGNTHNLVARGHFSLAHIKLDKNKRMKLNEPQQNQCLFNC
jgi:hypothetical protein